MRDKALWQPSCGRRILVVCFFSPRLRDCRADITDVDTHTYTYTYTRVQLTHQRDIACAPIAANWKPDNSLTSVLSSCRGWVLGGGVELCREGYQVGKKFEAFFNQLANANSCISLSRGVIYNGLIMAIGIVLITITDEEGDNSSFIDLFLYFLFTSQLDWLNRWSFQLLVIRYNSHADNRTRTVTCL